MKSCTQSEQSIHLRRTLSLPLQSLAGGQPSSLRPLSHCHPDPFDFAQDKGPAKDLCPTQPRTSTRYARPSFPTLVEPAPAVVGRGESIFASPSSLPICHPDPFDEVYPELGRRTQPHPRRSTTPDPILLHFRLGTLPHVGAHPFFEGPGCTLDALISSQKSILLPNPQTKA